MKKLVRIKTELKTITEEGPTEAKKLAQDILELLEEMEIDR